MLLREDAGGYVLVAVVSFAAAAAITALCIRLRNRENQKKGGADKARPARTGGEKPMKKRILSILLLCCMVLTMLPAPAFAADEELTRFRSDMGGLCEHHPEHDEACGYAEKQRNSLSQNTRRNSSLITGGPCAYGGMLPGGTRVGECRGIGRERSTDGMAHETG